MPFKRPGGLIDLGTLGDRQVPSVPATRLAMPPIQINRWVRNGLPPNAEYEDLKHEALNQAAMWRTKTCFQFAGRVVGSAPSSTAEDFWRTAFRSSSMAHAMIVSVIMLPPRTSYKDYGTYVQLKLFTDATESTEASSTDFYYGPDPAPNVTPGWPSVHEVTKMITIEPDTDYYVLIRRMEGADISGICALELASMAENNNGYLPQNIGAHDPVLDVYRQKQVTFLKDVWESYDSPVFQWSASPGGGQYGVGIAPNFDWKLSSSTTGVNILDWDFLGGDPGTNSTTVSANTPGWKPDMRMKARKSQTDGVPCVMKAFGKWEDAGASQPGGTVKLLDSTGATVAEIEDGWAHGADPQWVSVSFDLPASYAKYDVHFASNSSGLAGDFYLWAVSIYPVG